MKWLTNSPKDRLAEDLAALGPRHLVCDKPQATEKYSVDELEKMGLVGIYEA